ncbi:MAG: MotA/TolQ/ExbB proton channel family protein, partial [Akkermansiaceae bacterium]
GGFFLSALTVSAQTPVPKTQEMNFLEVLAKGGIMMYPLALLSVITVVLILIFILTIRRNAIVSDRFMNTSETMIRKRDYLGLISLSHRRNECMARITQKTLDFVTANPGASFENVRDVAQAEGSHQSGLLNSRISYLADIGAIAPLVGLLGTVLGMIEAFIEIATGEVHGVRQMGMADGVSKALIATAGGLAISIPALAFYSVFRGRVQKFIWELEAAATHFVALLQGQLERQSQQGHASFHPAAERPREEFAMPTASSIAGERPDLHGI